MLKRLAAALLVLISTQAQSREWTTGQLALLSTAATLHVVDWGQTRHIAKDPVNYHEKNPVLGEHPSTGTVDGYMLGSALVFLAAAHFLPEYRYGILTFWAASRVAIVVNNHKIGLRFQVGF